MCPKFDGGMMTNGNANLGLDLFFMSHIIIVVSVEFVIGYNIVAAKRLLHPCLGFF